jgi:hypothetical protein
MSRSARSVTIFEIALDLNASPEKSSDNLNPHSHFVFAVDDDAIPVLGLFLNALAVAPATDVNQAGGDLSRLLTNCEMAVIR